MTANPKNNPNAANAKLFAEAPGASTGGSRRKPEEAPVFVKIGPGVAVELLKAGLIKFDPVAKYGREPLLRWVGTEEELARILGKESGKND
jgi:hypothetical protein